MRMRNILALVLAAAIFADTAVFAMAAELTSVIEIRTSEQLDDIRNNLSGNYRLMNDIDLDGLEWIPIGSNIAPFTGTLDGNGHAIKNLSVIMPLREYVGLFGLTDGTLTNVGLEWANVIGGSSAGSLAGSNRGEISGCYVSGVSNVYGEGYVGGLVGYNTGSITKSYSTSLVDGGGFVGGFVGGNAGEINRCYATGIVSTEDSYIGGFAGGILSENSYIQNSFSLGNIESGGAEKSAGFIGNVIFGKVENCYSVSNDLNGFNGGGDVVRCYFDSSISNSDKPEGRTTAQMMSKSNYTGWDFQNIWEIDESQSYPYLRGLTKPDQSPPVIRDIVPRNGETVGLNPNIRVLTEDNSTLASVHAQYEFNGKWLDIGNEKAFGLSFTSRFVWDSKDYPYETVNMRFYAMDRTGNRSEYYNATYNVANKQTAKPTVIAEPGDMRAELSVTPITDGAKYKLYRMDGTEDSLIASFGANGLFTFTDHNLNPDKTYGYYAEATDINGNISVGDAVFIMPIDRDSYLPEAIAGYNFNTVVDAKAKFDGAASTDNVAISSYYWDFGNGNTSYQSEPVSEYEAPGIYSVSLTVTDLAGNTNTDTISVNVLNPEAAGTLKLSVFDKDTGLLLPNASVYAYFPEPVLCRSTQNGEVPALVTTESGEYYVAAYAAGYIPAEKTFEINVGETTEGVIYLTKGEVAVGEMTSKRLSLQEIEEKGIDLSDPANWHVFEFEVVLVFKGVPLPTKTYMVNGSGGFLGGSGGSGGGGAGGGISYGGGTLYPNTIPSTRPDEPPTLVFLNIPGKSFFLKDFFEITLIMHNDASAKFALTENTAILNLPDGLSLAPIFGGQKLEKPMGDIAGGDTESVSWLIRGDIPGSYEITTSFSGQLAPFGDPIEASFQTNIVINDTYGLALYIKPESEAYEGKEYKVNYELKNESEKSLYKLYFEFGSDMIEAEELLPGESLTGTLSMTFESRTGKEGLYYKLVDTMVKGGGLRIIVMWDTPTYGSMGYRQLHQDEMNTHLIDPVDIVNGNLTWEYTDFELYGAQRLSFARYYNSQSDNETTIGRGWRHSFDYRLTVGSGGALVTVPNGYEYMFTENPDGTFSETTSGVTLKKTAYGYSFVLYDGTNVSFDVNGSATEIADITDNKTMLTYDGGLLTQASNRAGSLYFTYSGGRISTVSDDDGRTAYYIYDGMGRLIKFTNADSDTLGYTYDNESNLTEVSDFNGNTYMKNTFINGQVVEQYLADQGTSYFAYDPLNRVTKFTNATGETFLYYYDENYKITSVKEKNVERRQEFKDGNLVSSTDYLGYTTKYEYDGAGNCILTKYPDSTSESFLYNDKRQVTKAVSRDGTVTEYTYDVRGNMTSVKDPEGNLRRFEYDADNNLLSYTDAMGARISFAYDINGNRVSMTDALGNTARYEYDSLGRLSAQITPKGERTQYEYTPAGKLIKMTDPAGNTQSFEVNGNGFNTGETDAMGNTTTTAYDKMNNPISVTDPEGGSVGYKYDASGNLIQVTDAMGNVTAYSYDYNGRLLSSTDPNGNIRRYDYDANGQLVKTTDPNGFTSSIAYDIMGRPVSVTNGRNAVTGFSYDTMGRVTSSTNALGGVTATVYDQNGNVTVVTDVNGGTWRYEYDKENRLIKSIDPLNGETRYEYDLSGRLIKTITSGGSVYESSYDANGQLKTEKNPIGNTYENVYDNLGRLIQSKNPDGTNISFEYDKNGLLISATDENGGATSYVYDKNGRVTKITDVMGGVTSYIYDKNGRATSVTDAMGGTVHYSYDKNGNPLSVTDAGGGKTVYEYDKLNRVLSMTDPAGGKTVYTYDANGNVTQIRDAEGNTSSYSYDLLDRLISYTDAEGNTFTFTYSKSGSLTSQTDALGNKTSFDYDALDRLTLETDPAGGAVEYFYDSEGRTTKIIDQEGAETSYEYDLNGRVVKITDALGNKTQIVYDSMDRVIKTIDAKGAATTYAYTKTGLVKSVTDALGGVMQFEYDPLGRLVSEINQNGEKVSYTYDALGRVLSVTDVLGNSETLSYDALGRITAVTDKKGNTTSYGYDKNGNLTQTTDAQGVTSYFEYDKLNRLVKATLNGDAEQVTLYKYDKRGLVTHVINAVGGTKIYVYDKNGNPLSETDEDGYAVAYAYDARGLVESANYSGGKKADLKYDKAGRLVELSDWTGKTSFSLDLLGRITSVNDQNGKVTGYNYDAVGNQVKIEYPDGSAVQNTYDALNRLTAVTATDGVTAYTYDPAGHVKSMTYPNGISELYNYDRAGQLIETTQINRDGTNELLSRFTYDPAGNIIKSEGVGFDGELEGEMSYSEYNNLNQLTSKTVLDNYGNIVKDFSYIYDKRGNLIKETENGREKLYLYDETNKMVKGINADGEESSYTYNGLGILTRHNDTDYVVDYTSEVYNNLMATGSDTTYRYVYGVADNRIAVTAVGTTLYIQNDRLGSGRFATDAQGNVVAHTYVDEWGKILDKSKAMIGNIEIDVLDNFTNHGYDETLEIYYAKARFYDPNIQRFLAIDPIRDGLNWYAYAENNPVMFVDPLGLANFNVALTDSGIGSPIDNIIAGINSSISYDKDRLSYNVNDEKTYYNSLEYMLFHSSQSDLERFYNTYYNPNQLHNPYTDLFFLSDETTGYGYDDRMTALQYFNKYGGCMKRWEEETGMSKNDGLAMSYAYTASSAMKYSSDWLQEMIAISAFEAGARLKSYNEISPYQPPKDSGYDSPKLNENKGKGYEIDWNKGIKGTQEVIPGTNVPKSFVMEGKFVNGNEVWVHGNATKHMGEFINSANGSILVENELMVSFKDAVSEILPKVQPGRNFFDINGWQIGINGDTGVIFHALLK